MIITKNKLAIPCQRVGTTLFLGRQPNQFVPHLSQPLSTKKFGNGCHLIYAVTVAHTVPSKIEEEAKLLIKEKELEEKGIYVSEEWMIQRGGRDAYDIYMIYRYIYGIQRGYTQRVGIYMTEIQM